MKVEPEVPGLNVNAYGTTIYIHGSKRGRTVYRVTLDPSLRDQFGQTLGKPATVSFSVGPAPASLYAAGGTFVVLDPAGGPHYSVYSVNHPSLKVSLYAVEPKEYDSYVAHMRSVSGYYDEKRQKPVGPPGSLVSTKTVKVAGQPDEMTETRLDLSAALKGGRGNVFVVVEPTVRQTNEKRRGRDPSVQRSWVQVTGIGLDAFTDREELVGWATSLADGRPLEGVEMTVLPSGTRALSGRDGLARMPLPPSASGTSSGMLLLARRGDETAFLPEWSDWWSSSSNWVRRGAGDVLRWYVFDDRKMYRPGEEVSIKGWLRRVGERQGGRRGRARGRGRVGHLYGAATRAATRSTKGAARAERARRLRHEVQAARHDEPRHARTCRFRRRAALARRGTGSTRTDSGAGVSPPRVRGEREGERGAALRRRPRAGDRRRRATTRAAGCPTPRSTGA